MREHWVEQLGQDLRYTLRTLRRAPAFAALVIGTLAVGIGANATIFSVVDAVFLRPFPYAAPERLVQIFQTAKDRPSNYGNSSLPNFQDWRKAVHTFAGLVGAMGGGANLTTGSEAERITTISATANLFDVLGVHPVIGRGFAAREDEGGGANVAVLSDGFWRRRFGGDPGVIGRVIDIDGKPMTIIGVMPRDFVFPAGASTPDLWRPLGTSTAMFTGRGQRFLDVYGRIAPPFTFAQASAELRQIAARLEQLYPDDNANNTVQLIPLRDAVAGSVRQPLFVLLGAV